jgi:hypothetical protein
METGWWTGFFRRRAERRSAMRVEPADDLRHLTTGGNL